jgi:hypothetical protein
MDPDPDTRGPKTYGSDGSGTATLATGVSWVRRLLYQTKLTGERVRVLAAKMENSVAELKRRGSKVTSTLMNSLLFGEASNQSAANMFSQQKFLG